MTGLENRWAWSQVEAMADRSLSADDEQRMRAEMARDARLADAVARASALRRELRKLSSEPVPFALTLDLLRVAREARPGRWPRPLWAAAAVAGLVVLAALLHSIWPGSPPPTERMAAVQEFQVAMTYLQRSAALTRREAAEAVGTGLQEALSVSREAVRDNEPDPENGGEEDGN